MTPVKAVIVRRVHIWQRGSRPVDSGIFFESSLVVSPNNREE